MMVVGGILFWCFVGTWLFLIRPKSAIHQIAAVQLTGKRKLFLAVLLGALIVLLGFLMTLSPFWNGEIPGHRNQYELITESFLKGRLDFDYEENPELLAMANPYDVKERIAKGVEVHFDHAFYHGKYYMYFGVVPVFLVFMPYRLLTGHALVTWQATFLFTAVFLIGMTVYLYWLVKRFFPKMSWGAYLSLLTSFFLASVVYEAKYPALYQTPVACGMMLEIWSLYCFSKAFCKEKTEDFSLGLAVVGALLGALTFGCRPPLAMANLLVVPLLFRFLRGRKITGRILLRLCAIAIPYALVATGLMWYNAARFDNPFEFGQSYQLTIMDQSAYGSMFTVENLVRAPAGVFNSLFVVSPVDMQLPYLRTGNGAFAVCPLLLFCLAFLLPQSGQLLKKKRLYGVSVTLVITVMVIAALQIMWSPWLLDRYQNDYVYLLSIGAFCGAGSCFAWIQNGKKLSRMICLASLGCVFLTALVFMIPFDENYTAYDQDAILRIWNFITLKTIR